MVVNSTTDIVNALVAKGVLTEEEGALLNKGRTDEAAGQAKAIKKAGKVSMSDAIDNATVYGEVRVRYEDRTGDGLAGTASVASASASTTPIGYIGGSSGTAVYGPSTGTKAGTFIPNATERRERARYKITMGVKTESGPWSSDLAFAMGSSGRSDNATMGSFGSNPNTMNNKEALYVKRASVSYKATDWLTLSAGRMDNPLYTTPMVWDADLTFEGLVEKANYKVNDNLELFGTAAQVQYLGDKKSYFVGGGSSTVTNELLAFQGGGKYNFDDKTSAKAAITYTTYTHDIAQGIYNPGTGGTSAKSDIFAGNSGVNNLQIIEIPAEINRMVTDSIGVRVYGDYAYNTDASARCAKASGLACGDDSAWLLGLVVGSAKNLKAFESNKMGKGDWSARIWYQDVGAYSVDQNAVDSDFFDSRVNMKGTVFKGQYNVQDNVFANLSYGHATRKNNVLGTPTGAGNDIGGINLTSFDLLQLDLTYKF